MLDLNWRQRSGRRLRGSNGASRGAWLDRVSGKQVSRACGGAVWC